MKAVLDPPAHGTPAIEPVSLAGVLAEIAETAAETLELQQVFERVATAIRRLIPLDNMGVVRILDGQWAVLHATTVPCREEGSKCTDPAPLTAWSQRLRPRPGAIHRIDDAALELDASFPVDDAILRAGVRSSLWEPFRSGGFGGGVWASSYRTHAFTAEHQELLRPIAALLGSAVEHWRIWDAERRRRERLDQLEARLGTLAESLDVRDVFERVTVSVRDVLPHDLVVLTEFDPARRTLRIVASAGSADIPVPAEPFALSDQELERRAKDFEILRDIPSELEAASERERLLVASGMRSWLRVPVWVSDDGRGDKLGDAAPDARNRIHGGLGFFSREPSRYAQEDVEVATRLADRVGLVLSHQRLAEEARLASEARERAERLEATVETLTRELEARGRERVVGVSRSWREVLQQVGRVAASETTVLITGESGTGKEIVARLVRQGSARAQRPLVALNCAALPEQLLESELFGHEKGAFTGAVATKVGRIEQAAGGTLFLDEIAEMSPLVQAKLLRVLQEREFQRVGGVRPLKADVRLVAATNRDLRQAIAHGAFREDLYYRLAVFEIHVPPLRERPDDVLPLAEAFLEELGATMGRPAAGISRDARERLLSYAWPGNVRELRNAIERAILLCDGGLITAEHLPTGVPAASPGAGAAGAQRNGSPAQPVAPSAPGALDLGSSERELVERALEQARGNKSKAARLLGVSRAQLYTRLERHGLL